MKTKIHLGLIGSRGAGKNTFVTLLKKIAPDKKIAQFRSGDICGIICEILHIPQTRENLQKIPKALWTEFPPNIISNAVQKTMFNYPTYTEMDIAIFNGMRTREDVAVWEKLENCFIVYITAPVETRWNRAKEQNEKKGKNIETFEEFMEKENEKTELSITKIGKEANLVIENTGTLEQFEQFAERAYRLMVL